MKLLTIVLLASTFSWLLPSETRGDTRLPYADMVQAYQEGRLADARRLGRGHLSRANASLSRTRTDSDREGGVRDVLRTAHAMLEAEDRLTPQMRLGNDAPLARYIGEVLVSTERLANGLPQATPAVQQFVQREFGATARLWLRAASQLPRLELAAFYQVFQDRLRRAGFNTIDDALAEPVAPAPEPAGPVAANAADTGALTALARDYFSGLHSGDTTRLRGATGLGAAGLSRLMSTRDESYRREGLRSVTGVNVPDQPRLRLQPVPGDAGAYEFTVSGIVLDLERIDGSRGTRTIEKLFRARKDPAGRWTLVILN